MLFAEQGVILRGGGDLGTGVAYRLHKAGFPVLVLELARPLVVRRQVALATAVLDGEIMIEGLRGRLVQTTDEALRVTAGGDIPVLVAADLAPVAAALPVAPFAVVDARLAKRNIDTRINDAPLVIGLGPGFAAGHDCHAVIETKRGHTLGRVLWQGSALPNTGTPGVIAGKGAERVLRAPRSGRVAWQAAIGDRVQEGQALGDVAGAPVHAPFDGVIRGLIAPGSGVAEGFKIGDVDARADRAACFSISDKALAIGGGVLEALLARLNEEGLAVNRPAGPAAGT